MTTETQTVNAAATSNEASTSASDQADARVAELSDLQKERAYSSKQKDKVDSQSQIIKDLKTQMAQFVETKQENDGEVGKLLATRNTQLEQANKAAKTDQEMIQELTNQVNGYKTEHLTKQFMDIALQNVNDKEYAETMLLGLYSRGFIDSIAPEENIEEQAELAAKLLEDKAPNLFRTTNSTTPGGATGTFPGSRVATNAGTTPTSSRYPFINK